MPNRRYTHDEDEKYEDEEDEDEEYKDSGEEYEDEEDYDDEDGGYDIEGLVAVDEMYDESYGMEYFEFDYNY